LPVEFRTSEENTSWRNTGEILEKTSEYSMYLEKTAWISAMKLKQRISD